MLRVIIFCFISILFLFFVFVPQKKFSNLVANPVIKIINKSDQADKSFETFIKNESILIKSGHLVLINFWASWCGPCMRELPSLNRLSDLYKSKNLSIYTINSDYDDQDKIIEEIVKKFGLSLNIHKDKNGQYTSLFSIEGLPVTILYKDGNLIEKINGELDFDSSSFHKKIDQLLLSAEKN